MADTNKGSLRYAVEATWGATPAGPAMTELRITGESLAHQKQTVVSQEVRSDRQRADVLEVGQGAAGDFNYELSYGSFEDFYESAMASTIASAVVTNASVVFAASTITVAAGGLTTFKVGQNVRITGGALSAANVAVAQIASVNASVLTITGTTLAVQTASAIINGRMLRNGTTEQSLLMEANFSDIAAVKYFLGMEASQMSLNVQSQQIVTGVFSFMGKRGYTASVTVASTVATANTNTPMTAAANVGTILEGGAVVSTTVQSINFNLASGLRQRFGVGNRAPGSLGQGGIDVNGTMNLYFDRIGMYDKFISHTSTSLSFRFTDASSNIIIVTLPKIYLSGGDPNISGIDADVFLPAQFIAVRDPTTGCTIQMDFLPATP